MIIFKNSSYLLYTNSIKNGGYFMKKFLKFAVLGMMAFLFMILPAYSKTEKLSKETKTMLIEKLKTSTLVVYNKDGETETFEERGLLPPLNYLDKDNFKGKYIFDRTVGRAAAYLYVYGDAEYVYANKMSKPAKEILKKNHIKFEAKKTVDEIQNKSNTGLCPFEELTKNAENTTQAYGMIYKKMHPDTAVVYFTPDITSDNLVEMYKTIGKKLTGKTAVKLHSGEPGGHNFLQPEFVEPIVKHLKGTIVECNTAYEGKRDTTEEHKQTIKEHGFDKIAKVDIMDEDGEMELPVPDGKQIKVNYVGSHLKNYDSMLMLSHFKGHQMGGFGGALKNMSIGVASSHGKAYIHGAGKPDEMWTCEQDKFLEAMADADKSVMDYMKGNITFINVMTRMSIDCDCNNNPAKPEIADIGILGSDDPVAIDQACVDLVYQSNDAGKKSLIERIEAKHGIHTVEAAADLGIGVRKYKLITIK